MNVQTLKSKLLKGEIDGTKEVVAVIDNKEYNLIGLTKSPGKVLLVAELKEGIHVGESVEDEKKVPVLDETKEVVTSSTTVAEDIEMDKNIESKKKE